LCLSIQIIFYLLNNEATVENVKIVRDGKGNIIFTLPIGTVLDNIILDLWTDIIKYQNIHSFIICDKNNLLPGFKIVNENDFDSIKSMFLKYYDVNEGIPNFAKLQTDNKHSYFVIGDYYTKSQIDYVTCNIVNGGTKIILQRYCDIPKYDLTVMTHNVNYSDDRYINHWVLMIQNYLFIQ
jgi:hypothetical protein